jgi:hypothetical protein
MLKGIRRPAGPIILTLVLVLLLLAFTSLYLINGSIVIGNKSDDNDHNNIVSSLGNQIKGIVKDFIGKVQEKATNSSSCKDIGLYSSGGTSQAIVSNNGGSNVVSLQSSGGSGGSSIISRTGNSSSNGAISSSSSGAGSSMITSSSGTGDSHDSSSQSIVSVLGGSDSRINNIVCGGPNNSVLVGGPGNNIIYAGPGRHTLIAGPDDNILIGGSGPDHFVCGQGHTTIRNFDPSKGDTKTDDCKNY